MARLLRPTLLLGLLTAGCLVGLRVIQPNLVVGENLGALLSAGAAMLLTLYLVELKRLSLGAGSVGKIIALWTWGSLWILFDLVLGLRSFGVPFEFEAHWWLILMPGAAVFYWLYELQRHLRYDS
jgi:hypothetical protein